jgi:hypothetical protein
MSLLVPETQAAFPFTGTFVANDGLGATAIFTALAGARGMAMNDGGDFLTLGGSFIDRPPLAWGGTGTVVMNYSANLAANQWENVSGAFVTVTITEKRDYAVLLTFQWYWNTTNWAYNIFRVLANGSETGIFPIYFYKFREQNASIGERELQSAVFYLRQWEPGTYTIQLQHSPWGSSQDRYVERALLIVL